MSDCMLWAYVWGANMLHRLRAEERGDQNVGALGLIVVTMLIVGVLIKVFVPGVSEIITDVMASMKEKLKVS